MLGPQEWQSDFCARLVDKYAHSFRDTIEANRILRDLRAPISDVDGGQAGIYSDEIESFKRDLYREKKRIRFFAQIIREFTPGEFADRCFLSLQNITASLADIEQCGDFPSIAKIVADKVIAVLDELEDAAHQHLAKSPAASPENDEQDSFEGARQLSREAAPKTSEGAFDDGDGAGKAQDATTFRILLLSDLHFGMKRSDWLWPNLQEAFGADLRKECIECGPIDLVFFLGDMVFSGAKKEFDKLQPLLNSLWKQMKKGGCDPPLLAIPGNHDVRQPTSNNDKTIAKLLNDGWDNNDVLQEQFWQEPKCANRKFVKRIFQYYERWWKDDWHHKLAKMEYRPGLLPGDFSCTFEKTGKKIGIVGLNSTFFQHLDKTQYEGRLPLHQTQFHESCGKDGPQWSQGRDACLLLTHHPYDWLSKEGRKQFDDIYTSNRFAVHLHGHKHTPSFLSPSQDGRESRHHLQCPSLFGCETYWDKQKNETSLRTHGYVVLELDIGSTGVTFRFRPKVMAADNRRIIRADYYLDGLDDDGWSGPHPGSGRDDSVE